MKDDFREDCALAGAYVICNLILDTPMTEDEAIPKLVVIIEEAIKRYVAERGVRVHQQSAN